MKKMLCAVIAVLLTLSTLSICVAEAQDFSGTTLVVFNCYEYIDPEIITLFEHETGAKVDYVNYETNEQMFTKLEAGAADYDVVFPSDYMIERLISLDMLEEIDPESVPNREGVLDSLRHPDFDPEEKYHVPYMWGTFGILYNTELYDGAVDSWGVLFDKDNAGEVIMMNSQRDSIGLALKYLGYSMNTRDEGELEEAKELLIEQKKAGIPAGYLLDETKDMMIGGEAALAVIYSGDAIYAMDRNPSLEYVIPNEGGNVWIDGACIIKGTKNKECAEAFINFLCREDVAQKNVDFIRYSTPISSVAEKLSETEDARTFAVMNPSNDVLERCEFFHDILDAMDLYEAVWMEIRLAR